jgi:HAMP domain-containing protein
MPAPQSLIQAALNRLVVRLGSGLADAAAELSLLAQDTPGRLRREWQLFVEEVELEADRLDHGEAASPTPGPQTWSSDGQAGSWAPSSSASQPLADPQDQIDQLRAQVAALARQLEDRS